MTINPQENLAHGVGSKKTQLIDMLMSNNGSNINEISMKLGWQPHTTRAAITRLRKTGYEIETEKSKNGEAGLTYRITDGSTALVDTEVSQ